MVYYYIMLLMASNILHVSLLQVFASLIHAETPRGLGRHSSVDLPSMPRHAKTYQDTCFSISSPCFSIRAHIIILFMIWYLYDRIGYDIIFSSRVSSQRGSYLKRSISTCIFNHFYTSLANLQQIIHLTSEEHMWSSKGHSRHCTTPTFSKLWSSHLQVECRLWGMPCGNRRCVETVSFDLDAASSALSHVATGLKAFDIAMEPCTDLSHFFSKNCSWSPSVTQDHIPNPCKFKNPVALVA